MTDTTFATPTESVEEFRLRARAWLADTMPRVQKSSGEDDEGGGEEGMAGLKFSDEDWLINRELQKKLYSGGFAGLCYPKEYGGQGLPPAYQYAFNEELVGYEYPGLLQTPTFTICGPTILDMANDEQRKEHLTKAIAGEEVLVQFLSEPRGGSDLAGATTRATRDGDVFILNGSKIWSSGAYAGDYALCLARTDWEAPKHRGLTMFLVKIHQPGITIRRIRQVNGNDEFCQEFFDDVELPLSAVVGEVNGGWSVASRQTIHERNAVGGGSIYATHPKVSGGANPNRRSASPRTLIDLARKTHQTTSTKVREAIAETHVINKVQEHLIERVVTGMRTEQLPASSGAIIRLFSGDATTKRAEIALEVAGTQAVYDSPGTAANRQIGVQFLFRQGGSLGGGSTEISRNIISERILNMPREYAADRDIPFSQVRQSASQQK
jgi:alkylation response protein AidB-like acyl-CoA dehydrogenase